ncbi:urease accessory UreF family protein [Sorangium sp. So ce1036]|uniref:urease accessory protein UreF n=1 Tax=Sorangium sp. So ce1036 TaxID=3133328 RepID=UPI003EFF1038
MNRWLLLQLSDSAFPVGGFAHSAGLEAAVQLGEVGPGRALSSFVVGALWQVGLGALPCVRAAHERPGDIAAIDDVCDAFLVNHVANRASRTQGRAFLATSARVFPSAEVRRLDAAVRAREAIGHHAPMFGAALGALGVPREEAQAVYLHAALRGVVSAAVRLGLVGPLEAQRLQLDSAPLLDAVLAECEGRGLDELAQPAPLLDLFGAAQDRLYSRLFQS